MQMQNQTQSQDQTHDHRFFINDCYGNVFGNPKGYRRYRDAQAVATKNRWLLWDRFDKMKLTQGGNSNLLYSIEMEYVAI